MRRASRSFSRSQAAAAERGADTALRVFALRAQYIIAATNVDVDEAHALDATLSSLVDAHTYREAFLFRFARAMQYVALGERRARREATMRSMPVASLSSTERVRREAFLVALTLLRGKRSEASAALERGLLSEAPSDLMGRIEMAHAYAYRGVAYWVLDRPGASAQSFEFDTAYLRAANASWSTPSRSFITCRIRSRIAARSTTSMRRLQTPVFGPMPNCFGSSSNSTRTTSSSAPPNSKRCANSIASAAAPSTSPRRSASQVHRPKPNPKRDQEARLLRPGRGARICSAARLARSRL